MNSRTNRSAMRPMNTIAARPIHCQTVRKTTRPSIHSGALRFIHSARSRTVPGWSPAARRIRVIASVIPSRVLAAIAAMGNRYVASSLRTSSTFHSSPRLSARSCELFAWIWGENFELAGKSCTWSPLKEPAGSSFAVVISQPSHRMALAKSRITRFRTVVSVGSDFESKHVAAAAKPVVSPFAIDSRKVVRVI